MSPLCSAAGSPDPRMDLVHVSESRRGGRRSAQSEGQPSADGGSSRTNCWQDLTGDTDHAARTFCRLLVFYYYVYFLHSVVLMRHNCVNNMSRSTRLDTTCLPRLRPVHLKASARLVHHARTIMVSDVVLSQISSVRFARRHLGHLLPSA